ncbi:uncharacterized protein LOC126134432 [Schistocerca cancellata]|uniref:uncharacterized protein LOC126134432 n=1 Tax=Schistocerca cancellata TaxID=274614 RepID=UPI0021176F10|nr:uncharacterized protein LOC126134432 [Schistocerca cancellata]
MSLLRPYGRPLPLLPHRVSPPTSPPSPPPLESPPFSPSELQELVLPRRPASTHLKSAPDEENCSSSLSSASSLPAILSTGVDTTSSDEEAWWRPPTSPTVRPLRLARSSSISSRASEVAGAAAAAAAAPTHSASSDSGYSLWRLLRPLDLDSDLESTVFQLTPPGYDWLLDAISSDGDGAPWLESMAAVSWAAAERARQKCSHWLDRYCDLGAP